MRSSLFQSDFNSTWSVTIPGNSDLGLTAFLLFLVTKRALMQIGEERIGLQRYSVEVGYNSPLHPGQDQALVHSWPISA